MTTIIYNNKNPTNVEVEGGFDFWSELANDEAETTLTDNHCLLTQEPLTLNYITMPCGHKYNYIPICKEISNMKSPKTHHYNPGIKLARHQTICPYCRAVFDQLLPKIPMTDFVPAKYVCSSTNCIGHRDCQYVFQTGKRKGQSCTKKNAYDTQLGAFCNQHASMKKKAKSKPTTKTKIILDDEGKKIGKLFNIAELKCILKTNNLPVSGTKVVLITRLMQAKIGLDLSDK
jgi:hypothetical protein